MELDDRTREIKTWKLVRTNRPEALICKEEFQEDLGSGSSELALGWEDSRDVQLDQAWLNPPWEIRLLEK